MPEIVPDTLIDSRYKVLTRIGAGGMADVFCAEDQQLGRKVALKLLHQRFAEDADFVERFRREASAAAGLQHPNVVSIYDRGEWDGACYIAMEYIAGRSLKDVILQEAPLDPLRAIDITVQILKAARAAHRRGIVHRDLKPHNVLVDDEDRAKVTDFGIARAGASDMTETGSIVGTAQYLSPEQAQGHPLGPTSDLYAIGVILFELITGHVPFDADSPVTIALKHVSERPPAPSVFDPSVPPELETITLWALDKDPARRPQDADAFVAALEEARDHILARESPGQRTTFAPPMPMLPTSVGGDGEPGLPATNLYAPTTLPPYEQPPPYEADERRRSRRLPWWGWLLLVLALAGAAVGVYLLARPHDVAVPTVVGRAVRPASATLQQHDFAVHIERVTSAQPVDRVLAQDPAGGAHVRKGSTVALTVSAGPGTIAVPSVDGLTQQEATAVLIDKGLTVERVAKQPDDTVALGDVIRSSPAAGTSVPRASGVTLVVSSGPKQQPVPDVVGLSQDAAHSELTGQNFQVVVTQQPSSSAPVGQVLSQSPSAGTKVAPGSSVKLVVAQAPAQVAVPKLIGKTAAAAIDQLSAAGFQPRESTRTVTDASQDGVVLEQRPAAGSKVAKGAPVRLIVGQFQAPPTPPGGGGSQTTGSG
jgi:serine/threonine-protein kinase